MTTTDITALIAELGRTSKAATPGPHHIYTCSRDEPNWLANSELHNACSPQNIQAILSHIEGLMEQHHRDSAELRRLCAARDEQRNGRLAALERAGASEAMARDLRIALETCRTWFQLHTPTAPLINDLGDGEHPVLPAVYSYCLVSGANMDIQSDQHRAYSWRRVIGYSEDRRFICLQTEGCWPTVERIEKCWFAEIPNPMEPAPPPPAVPSDPLAEKDLAELRPFFTRTGADALIKKYWPDMQAVPAGGVVLDEREAFEAWASGQFELHRQPHCDYSAVITQCAWKAWQARALLSSQGQPDEPDLPAPTLENAPLGTRAPAYNGGYWIRVERGWKWCTGATFPRPGADWNGKLIVPAQPQPEVGNGSDNA